MANSHLKSRHAQWFIRSDFTDDWQRNYPKLWKPPQARILDMYYSLSVPMVTRVCIAPPPLQRRLFTSWWASLEYKLCSLDLAGSREGQQLGSRLHFSRLSHSRASRVLWGWTKGLIGHVVRWLTRLLSGRQTEPVYPRTGKWPQRRAQDRYDIEAGDKKDATDQS